MADDDRVFPNGHRSESCENATVLWTRIPLSVLVCLSLWEVHVSFRSMGVSQETFYLLLDGLLCTSLWPTPVSVRRSVDDGCRLPVDPGTRRNTFGVRYARTPLVT